MKQKMTFYDDRTIKLALSHFKKGWTTNEIAKKYKVSSATIYNWKKKFPKDAIRKVVTSLSANGAMAVKTTKKRNAPMNSRKGSFRALYVRIDPKNYDMIAKQAEEDCRTMAGQVKYYIIEGIKKHNGISF